jgi:hypothetical protein
MAPPPTDDLLWVSIEDPTVTLAELALMPLLNCELTGPAAAAWLDTRAELCRLREPPWTRIALLPPCMAVTADRVSGYYHPNCDLFLA